MVRALLSQTGQRFHSWLLFSVQRWSDAKITETEEAATGGSSSWESDGQQVPLGVMLGFGVRPLACWSDPLDKQATKKCWCAWKCLRQLLALLVILGPEKFLSTSSIANMCAPYCGSC